MKNKIIYIDLDGTVLDVSDRLYFFYKNFMNGNKKLKKNSYWNFKKIKISEDAIVRKTCSDEGFIKKYIKQRKKFLEAEKLLKHDKLIKSSIVAIKKFKKNNKLILLTARSMKSNLFKELKRMKILNFFDKVLSSNAVSKKDMILNDGSFNRKKSVIVGDTEEDIRAGKSLKIKTIAVLTGIRSKKYLKQYKPDLIVGSVKDIK
ncbi:HAD family hydrolase [Candidatus Woesearchaeota archaeon]|nr:HAD family hydrolase [Candidatus Woesearchaeota archaeon]